MNEADSLRRLARMALFEFGNITDFVWKNPGLLKSEMEVELKKLDLYFPLSGDEEKDARALELRQLRWSEESRKLKSIFPYLMASGNLFSMMSVFEAYCLNLCREMEKRTHKSLADIPGSGISRLFKYMTAIGIDLNAIELRTQILAAIKIRNCLFHATGFLSWSREEADIRRVISNIEYLSPEVRSRESKDEDEFYLRIFPTIYGEKIGISHKYVWILSSYLRDHFIGICDAALAVCGDEDGQLDFSFMY